ncbi:MAG: hypothetical protein ACREX8_00315 [Gammaproteobacteria bacterium]
MTVLTLLHHTQSADSIRYGDKWTATPAVGAPQVTLAMERALRRRVTDRLDRDSAPVRWWHCEGWGAVTDLHQAGRHGDAMDLARLLYWCDQRFTGRDVGCWEIARGEHTPGSAS